MLGIILNHWHNLIRLQTLLAFSSMSASFTPTWVNTKLPSFTMIKRRDWISILHSASFSEQSLEIVQKSYCAFVDISNIRCGVSFFHVQNYEAAAQHFQDAYVHLRENAAIEYV